MTLPRTAAALVLLLGAATAVYAPSFANGFRFDDAHVLVDNPALRDGRSASAFFACGSTAFSALPTHAAYRPLTAWSFALDVARAGGLDPEALHRTTFALYLVEALLIFDLARRARRFAAPESDGRVFGLAVAALRLLHAGAAETLNYHSARTDVLSTFCVVLGLWIFAAAPRLRPAHLGALVAAAGVFAKQSAAVYPALLAAWVLLVERRRFGDALVAALPALLLCGAAFAVVLRCEAPTVLWGDAPRGAYAVTQAWVILRYAASFLLPIDASVDHDQEIFASAADPRFLAGAAFLLACGAAIVALGRRPRAGVAAFGLVWFLVALAPTSSFVPLFEARNDHRTYFPYVGLALSAVTAFAGVASGLRRRAAAAGRPRRADAVVAAAFVGILAAHAWGASRRHEVWASDLALWEDAVRKSPRNGRAWMNAGRAAFVAGRTDQALARYAVASELTPDAPLLAINLGLALDAKGEVARADEAFAKAARLDPRSPEPPKWNGRRLLRRGRAAEAAAEFGLWARLAPDDVAARREHVAALVAADLPAAAVAAAREAAARFPADPLVAAPLGRIPASVRVAAERAATSPDADAYRALAKALHDAGRTDGAVEAARAATLLDPRSAGAWADFGAACAVAGRRDEVVRACREALRLDPSNALAARNLAWAEGGGATSRGAASRSGGR